MSSLSYYIKNPRQLGLQIILKCAKYIHNDKLYLQLRYYLELGKKLDLMHPQTFSEKLNWLKLYNRKSEYTMMVDKYAVKKHMAEKIGEEYIIPTIGVWNTPEEIDLASLPDQFVLKTTHGGGGNGIVICKNKSHFNVEAAIEKLNKAMKADIYARYREWPYKDVSRRIIAEQYMVDNSSTELKDYKFFCFNGTPKLCQVISDRRTEEKIDFYDMQWKRVESLVGLNPKVNNSIAIISCPHSFAEMKQIATTLSQDIPFSRIDLYEVNGHCYFGEITFFPAGGMGCFRPEEWNEKIGSWITL